MVEMQKLDRIALHQDRDLVDYHNSVEDRYFVEIQVEEVEHQKQGEPDNFEVERYLHMLAMKEEDNFRVDQLRTHFEAELEMEVVGNLVVGQDYHIDQAVAVVRLTGNFVEKDQKEDSLVDSVVVDHILQEAELFLVVDIHLVEDRNYSRQLEDHSSVALMCCILVVGKYLVVHIDLVDLEYMQIPVVLDNWYLDFDWHIAQDNFVEKVVEGNPEVLYIVVVQVQQVVL